MKIEALRYFVTLARAGSFYQASRISNLTVQGYAKMLTSLEHEVGAKLAIRDRTGVRLTQAGEILLEYALETTDGMSRTIERISRQCIDKSDDAHRLKMYLTHWGMQMVTHLDYLRDGLKVFDLREDTFEKVVARAENPDADDTFCIDVYSEVAIEKLSARMVGYEPFYHSAVGVVVREDSLTAALPLVPKSAVAGLELAHYPHREWSHKINEVFRDSLLTNIRFETTGIRMLFDYAKEDGGRAVISDAFGFYALQRSGLYDLSGLVFVPLDDSAAKFSGGMIYTRKRSPTLRAQAIMDHYRKYSQTMVRDYYEAFPTIARGVWNG